MYLAPTRCPVCGENLTVTKLSCPACDTAVEGRFSLSRMESLSPEHRSFVELFVRCEGKLSWVAQELGLSYPTVRARLEEVIRALGYEVRDEHPAEERQRLAEQRQTILDAVAEGRLSPGDAIRQLQNV